MPRNAVMLLTTVNAGSVIFVAKIKKPAKSRIVRLPPISKYRPTDAVTGTINFINEAHNVDKLPATASTTSLRENTIITSWKNSF